MAKPATKYKIVIAAVCIVIVAVVIALLLGNSIHRGPRYDAEGRTSIMIMSLSAAAESYKTDHGPFPKDIDNHTFWADLSGADSGKVYMEFKTDQINTKGEIVDPWGTPYRIWYTLDVDVGITSAGPDKTFGTADDISNQ